jgi:hypothetical protein
MNRLQAIPHVAYVVDDAGSGRPLGDDQHAIVRNPHNNFDHSFEYKYPSVLVGWQRGQADPMFVAVHSYLDVELSDDEATDLARDYLAEFHWIINEPTKPDYIIR